MKKKRCSYTGGFMHIDYAWFVRTKNLYIQFSSFHIIFRSHHAQKTQHDITVALLTSCCVIQTHKQQHGFFSSFIFYYLGKKTVPLQIEFVYNAATNRWNSSLFILNCHLKLSQNNNHIIIWMSLYPLSIANTVVFVIN